MNSIFKFAITICVISIILSCNKENKSIASYLDSRITIIDSIKVELSSAILTDMIGDNILIYNYISSDIGVYNLKDNKIKVFNKFGSAPSEFKSQILPYSLKFINDSLIGVSSSKGIKVYNFNGVLVENININIPNNYSTISNFSVINDSLIISINKPNGDPSLRNFYEQDHKLLLRHNNSDASQVFFADFPLKNSDFNNKDFFYPYPYVYYHQLDKIKNEYSFVNSNDSNIYTYNVLSTNLIKVVPLKLEHYKRLKIPFGSDSNISELEEEIQFFTNSIIEGYYKTDINDYVVYTEAKDRDEVIDHFRLNPIDGPDYKPLNLNIWIHVLFNDSKIMKDILVPSNFGVPIAFYSKDKVIIRKSDVSKYDDLNGITTFYIGQIQE